MDFTHRWPSESLQQPPPPPPPPDIHHPYNPYPRPPLQQPESLQPPPPPPEIHHPYNPYPRPPLRAPSPIHYPNPNAYVVTPLRPPPHAESSCNVGAGKGLAAYYYERLRKDPVGFGQKGSKSNNKKGFKLTKVVQSARCEVCKIECNTQEVLDAHKQGKKHKKKLQLLQEKITPKPLNSQVTTNPKEMKEQEKRKDAPIEEDLETKKRRILGEGVQPNEVKVCTICNVVANSQKVFDHHIAGSKHAAMVRKQQEAAAAASGSSQKI